MAKKDSVKMLEAKIELLKRAKERFNTGVHRGICAAISWSCDYTDNYTQFAGDNLRDYISRQLGNSAYLEHWIAKNRSHLKQDNKSMKKYRLQWIDWMISCLEEDLQAKKA